MKRVPSKMMFQLLRLLFEKSIHLLMYVKSVGVIDNSNSRVVSISVDDSSMLPNEVP